MVVDLVEHVPAPHDPVDAAKRFALTAKRYGLYSVSGDKYAADFAVRAFADNGVTLEPSQRTASDIFSEAIHLLSSGRIAVPHDDVLLAELRALERRAGRQGKDDIGHPKGYGHDDVAVAACGAAVLAAERPPMEDDPATSWWVGPGYQSDLDIMPLVIS